MKHKLLQLVPLLPYLENRLAERYEVELLSQHAEPLAWLDAHGGEFTAIATSARIGASLDVLQRMPALRVISSFGVGYETFDLADARKRGLQIGYTPDVLNDCVADTAFGLVIDVARRFSASDRFVREGRWLRAAYPLTTKVSGKRLGIVGLGRIGRVIAHRASGFDMEVRYHNRKPVADVAYGYEASLVELARWCDFLVVASAAGPDAQQLISAEVLQALGPEGFLVNVSRGSLVDEAALVRALRSRSIAGAGLDVYADEPRVPQSLLALDNVVLLPHVASATHETRRAMADRVVANLDAYFADGRVPVAVPL